MNGINVFSDTNPLIYLLNGSVDIANILDGKVVWLSVISELELFGKKGLGKEASRTSHHVMANGASATVRHPVEVLRCHSEKSIPFNVRDPSHQKRLSAFFRSR